MDPELKAKLEELKREFAKNVEVTAKVAAIEQAALQRDANVTKLTAELETFRQQALAREQQIEELRRQTRLGGIARDGITQAHEGAAMLGMLVRQQLSRHLRCDVPADFRNEDQLVRDYLQRTTLAAGATPGSYLVPTVTESTIIDTIEQVSDLLSRVDFVPGLPMAGTINIPTLTGRPSLQPARVSSDTAMSASDPVVGSLPVTPQEAYIYFPVDNRLLAMSAVALGSLLMSVIRDGIVGGVCRWLVVGDGTSTYNSITGILNQSTAAYIYTLDGGKTKFSDVTVANARAAKKKCLARGRANGVWLGALDVLGLFEDESRTGKVPAVTFMPDGTTKLLSNVEVVDEDMPDLSTDAQAGKGFLGFGDLNTFLVGLAGGIQIQSDASYLFGKNQTAFRGTINADIQRKPVATFITLKTAGA